MSRKIRAGRSFESPIEAPLVASMVGFWRGELADVPGSARLHALRVVGLLGSASPHVSHAFDRKYASDALSDLAKAKQILASADKELGLLKSGK